MLPSADSLGRSDWRERGGAPWRRSSGAVIDKTFPRLLVDVRFWRNRAAAPGRVRELRACGCCRSSSRAVICSRRAASEVQQPSAYATDEWQLSVAAVARPTNLTGSNQSVAVVRAERKRRLHELLPKNA
jgi:hypothetical protein